MHLLEALLVLYIYIYFLFQYHNYRVVIIVPNQWMGNCCSKMLKQIAESCIRLKFALLYLIYSHTLSSQFTYPKQRLFKKLTGPALCTLFLPSCIFSTAFASWPRNLMSLRQWHVKNIKSSISSWLFSLFKWDLYFLDQTFSPESIDLLVKKILCKI